MNINPRRYLGLILVGLGLAAFVLVSFRQWRKVELDGEIRGQLEGDFIELPDGVVHYQLTGPRKGDLVILIHGFSVPSYVWKLTAPVLEEEGYRVLQYDLYGRGYSDRPDLTYNLDLFVFQLDELWKALELVGPAHLVGLSMGGPIAARFAARYPDRVRTLSLIAPEAGQTTWKDIFPLNLPGVGELLMVGFLEPVLLPSLQEKDFYSPDQFPDWEERYREQIQYRGFGRALLSTVRQLPALDPEEEYQKMSALEIPVLLIWGREDQTFSRSDMEGVIDVLPEADFQIIPDAGHLPHLERSELVNPLLLEFLAAERH